MVFQQVEMEKENGGCTIDQKAESGEAESKISTYDVKDYDTRKEAKRNEFTLENEPLPPSLQPGPTITNLCCMRHFTLIRSGIVTIIFLSD